MDVEKKWHVDKTISLANIIIVCSMAMGGFGAYDSLTDRMAVMETNMSNLNDRVVSLIERQINVDQAQDNTLLQFRQEMRTDVRSVQDKLDRLLERGQ
jgi:hypothetical protein